MHRPPENINGRISEFVSLMTNCPCKTIGSATDINVAGNLQGFDIHDDYIIISRASHKGPRTIGIHKNSCRTVTDFQSLYFLTGPGIVNSQVSGLKTRDECELTICCKG